MPAPPAPWTSLLAVATGGAAGSVLRWVLTAPDGAVPVRTLVVNVVGSFLLAWLATSVFVRPSAPPWLRPLLGTGLLGGFTTFSAVSVATVALGADGEAGRASAYLAATVVGAFGASAAGVRLGSRRRPA